AFTRVYGSDKVAACINAPKNTNISIPVGALWGNGTTLMNAYDGSEATVTGGSITFNSGKNGTVLVQEPDNSPRVTLVGDTSFKTDTHELTVSLKNVSSAKISIDGGPETTVTNGQKITIGAAAAYGATISVKVSWESEGKTVTRTFSYKKLDPNAVTHARVHIQPVGGSAPYLHMWTASVSHVLGAWPGTQLTQKDADGWWVIDVPTVEGAYNIVVNNGSGAQSGNIEGLEGEVWIAVPDGDYTKARVTDSPGPTASPTPTGATPTPTPSPSPTPIPTPTSEFAYSIHIYDWNDTPQLTELSNKELPALTFSDPISSANKWRSVSFTSTQNRLDLELQWGGNGRTIFSRTNSGGPIGHVGRFTLTAEYPNVYLFSGGPAGADINPYSTVYVSPVAAVGDKLTMRFSVLSYQQPITLSAKNFASPWTPMTMQESAAIPAQLVPTGESANEYMRLYTYSHDYAPGSYPDEFKITRQSRLYPGGENNGAPLTAAAPKDNAFVIVSAAGLSNLKVGVAVTGSVSFTVDNGTWASAIAPSAFTVTGLPAGLTAGAAVRTSDTVVTVPVTGIPTTAGSGGLALGIPTTVPAANITGAWGAIPILGTVSTGVVAKGDRPAPSAPTLSGKTESTIVIVNATDMEYAINTVNVAPAGGWQSGGAGLMTFSGLAPDTAYFIFARRPGNANYNNSVASPSLAVTTDKTAIASVAVAVTGPSTGAAPNTAAVPAAGSNFTAGPVSWSPTATVFAGSTQYTATVKLTPNAGESFAGGVNATINGFAAGVVYNADGTITLSYQFAATSAKTITGIAIVTQPAKLAYTSGEKLDLNGLSVRLTFSDNSTETVAFAAFAASNISTGPANGTAITAALNGTTIRVYVGSFSANTNAISVNKATGAAVNAPAAVSVTSRSVTVSSSLQTATGQTIEYAVSTSSTAPATGWQDSSTFSGLAPDTEYWFFARSKENADCNTGPVSTGTRVKTNVTPAVTLRGDANVDNQVNAADAAAILRHLVQLQLLTEQGERNAKVTPGDGPISAADAARILRWLVQLIEGDL
ncbi:MAG: starch-binding protein, partial [Clostridiales bacterium]|nr:starch-binding protein [Clostridiales bacterium]